MDTLAQFRESAANLLRWVGVEHISPLVSHLTALGFGLAVALILFGQSPQFGMGLKPRQMITAYDPEVFKNLPNKVPMDGYLVRDLHGDVACLLGATPVTMLKVRPTILIKSPLAMVEILASLSNVKGGGHAHFPEISIRTVDSARDLPLCIRSTKVTYGGTD